MRKEYKYSNLKQETNTSGIVMLEPSKKTKKRKPGIKPPRTSLRDVVMDTRNLLIQFMNKQEEFNKQVLNRLDNVDRRLDSVEDVLQRHDLILEHNNLK